MLRCYLIVAGERKGRNGNTVNISFNADVYFEVEEQEVIYALPDADRSEK